MSNAVFPSLPGLDIALKRSKVYSTLIQTAASGKKLSAAYSATPFIRYTLPINFLRTLAFNPALAQDEAAQLEAFFASVYGSWDTFLFTDPKDGVQRRVRFEQDAIDFEQIVSGVWKTDLTMITEK